MKTLIISCITSIILYFAPAYTIKVYDTTDKYCAKLKDGKIVVMHKGMQVQSDVTLTDGSLIKADGSLITKDGIKRFMRDGECVTSDGKMMDPGMKESVGANSTQ